MMFVIFSSQVPWFCDDNGTLASFPEGSGRTKMEKII